MITSSSKDTWRRKVKVSISPLDLRPFQERKGDEEKEGSHSSAFSRPNTILGRQKAKGRQEKSGVCVREVAQSLQQIVSFIRKRTGSTLLTWYTTDA